MRNVFIKLLKLGCSNTFFLCFSCVFDLVSDMREGWMEIKLILNKHTINNYREPLFGPSKQMEMVLLLMLLGYRQQRPQPVTKVHIRALMQILARLPLTLCSIILLFSASQLQIAYSFQSEHFLFPQAQSPLNSFAFPSFARKWPPDQPFSELCLNRCNTKN